MSMNYEESVVDISEAGAMLLQDILAMPEPQRTYYLRAWVEYGNVGDDEGGVIKIATSDRRPTTIPSGNKTLNISPKGKRVQRLAAIRLLMDFGLNGLHYGRDLATGMSRDDWETMQYQNPELANRYKNHRFQFNENYLIQVPIGADSDDEDIPSSKE